MLAWLSFGARVVMHSCRSKVKRDFSYRVVYQQTVNHSLDARQAGAGINDRSMPYDVERASEGHRKYQAGEVVAKP